MRFPAPRLSLALAAALIPAAGVAAPATPEGAKALLDEYAAFFSPAVVEKGLVSAEPAGESYKVTWDVRKALDLAGVPAGVLSMGPVSYMESVDGSKRTFRLESWPKIEFRNLPGKPETSGTIESKGLRLDATYDPQATTILALDSRWDGMRTTMRVTDDAGRTQDVDATLDGGEQSVRIEKSADGVDVAATSAFEGMTETVKVAKDASDLPFTVTASFGKATSRTAIAGLRGTALVDLYRFIVAHAGGHDDAGLAEHIRAALPLWNSGKVDVRIAQTKVDAAVASFGWGELAETVELSGVAPKSEGRLALSFDGVDAKSPLLPDWTAALRPLSVALDARFSLEGLDKIADAALSDAKFGSKGGLTDETQRKIERLYIDGHPVLTVTKFAVTSGAGDVAARGEVLLDASPTLHFHVDVGRFDDLVEVFKKAAGNDRDAAATLVGLGYVRMLATVGADGRIGWDIDVVDKRVTVNGQKLPGD